MILKVQISFKICDEKILNLKCKNRNQHMTMHPMVNFGQFGEQQILRSSLSTKTWIKTKKEKQRWNRDQHNNITLWKIPVNSENIRFWDKTCQKMFKKKNRKNKY